MKLLLSCALVLLYSITYGQQSNRANTDESLIAKSLAAAQTDSARTTVYSILADKLSDSDPDNAATLAHRGLFLAKKISYEKGIFRNAMQLALLHQGRALFDSSIVYFHQAHRSAKREQNMAGFAEAYSGLGHSFMRLTKMDSARYYLDAGFKIAEKTQDIKIMAGITNNYGNVFLEEGDLPKALDYFLKAARYYKDVSAEDYHYCLALSNIGNVQYRLGNVDQALDYARLTMKISKRKNYSSSIGYAHKLLGRIYRQQKKYDSALVEYDDAIKFYSGSGDLRSVSETLMNTGNIYFDRNQYSKALDYYLQSLKLAKKISSKPLIAFSYSSAGQALMVLHRTDDALIYLDSSRVVAAVIGNQYLIMDNYEAMSNAYAAKGNYKKAFEEHQLFSDVKDSIHLSENRQQSEEAQAKYELEKKEAQIDLLQKDQELQALALSRKNAIQTGIVLALILVVVLFLFLLNWYRLRNREKRQMEVQRVRNMIAQDLHDDIGSTLSTINIISKLALHEGSGSSEQHLNRIAEQSSQMMESMTDIVWSINPGNDTFDKVVVKMKVFAAEILEPKNITYHFNSDEDLKSVVLSVEKRKNIFLLFKEAVNNVAKYSEASEVVIDLYLEPEKRHLVLRIRDNGKGFVAETSSHGNGLRNMDTRARAMAAEFTLDSALGKGTSILLRCSI